MASAFATIVIFLYPPQQSGIPGWAVLVNSLAEGEGKHYQASLPDSLLGLRRERGRMQRAAHKAGAISSKSPSAAPQRDTFATTWRQGADTTLQRICGDQLQGTCRRLRRAPKLSVFAATSSKAPVAGFAALQNSAYMRRQAPRNPSQALMRRICRHSDDLAPRCRRQTAAYIRRAAPKHLS